MKVNALTRKELQNQLEELGPTSSLYKYIYITKPGNGNWSSSIFEVIDCCVKVNRFSPLMTR